MSLEMPETTTQSDRDQRWIPVVVLYIVTALWAVVQMFSGENGAVYLLFWIAFALPPTTWVVMDSRRRKKPILHILQLIIFLAWPIAVPIYLAFTRGIYGIGLITLHVIGLIMVTCVFFYGTILLVGGPDAIIAK